MTEQSALLGFERKDPEDIGLLRSRLVDRIGGEHLFHTDRDRVIAKNMLARLGQRFQDGIIGKEKYTQALEGLDSLVPKRSDNGLRKIADINISPLMELTIKSRVESKEVEVAGKNGSWGSLPPVIRQEVVRNSNMIFEMTGNCTVRCSFCDLSKKGPIQEKIDLHSLEVLFRFFKDYQKIPANMVKCDALYWGSDPFDAKWKGANGNDYDYSDATNLYWNVMRGRSRYLYSSTAVPLGEELRILNFADAFLTKKKSSEILPDNYLRISLTNANKVRVEAIRKVLEALHENPVSDSGIEISSNRNESPAIMGKRWEASDLFITTWDIRGPNCRDDVVVGVNSIDGVTMEASSNERPSGELRSPILNIENGGKMVYIIPHHQEKTDFREDGIDKIYPDTVVTKVTMDDKKIERYDEIINKNPHRAFLRMIGVLEYLAMRNRKDSLSGFPENDKKLFRKKMAKEIELVKGYLNSGAKNKSMNTWMADFKKEKFF